MTTARPCEFTLELPESWTVVDPRSVTVDAEYPRLVATASESLGIEAGASPDLMAQLAVLVGDEAGEIDDLVIASCAAYCLRLVDVDPGDLSTQTLDGIRDVDFGSGVIAKVYERTVPVLLAGADELCVVLVFSTPNLSLVDEFDPMFDQIAASVRLVKAS